VIAVHLEVVRSQGLGLEVVRTLLLLLRSIT
jgi:hypothetical protein